MEKLKKFLTNDWIVGLSLLLIFLATNGYTYAWDDQHLEIPLLKSLIDPTLYVGDYYVDALKANFTSFLFPILAKIITVDQVPAAYFFLYLISRFFLFFYAYKLWKLITRDKFTASLCVLSFILVFRVEEFLYRTFSHQEFALAIIMAAIYYFFKSRYMRAAILFGIAANFHALYSLFPFCYMSLYLLWKAREDRGEKLLKSIGLFALFSLPFFIWTFKRFASHGPVDPNLYQNWIALYKIACPPTFLFDSVPLNEMLKSFSTFFKGTQQFWPVIAMWVLNSVHNATFRKDPKAHAFLVGGSIFLGLAFIFSYILPSRFFLDMNLARNIQFMQFILIGYTAALIAEKVRISDWKTGRGFLEKTKSNRLEVATLAVIAFSLLRFNNEIAALSIMAIFLLLFNLKKPFYSFLGIILIIGCIRFVYNHHFSHAAQIALMIIMILTISLYMAYLIYKKDFIKTTIILVPFLVLIFNNIYYHKTRLDMERTASGFWQLQRNWIDMQNYVRIHTPKDALFLTPNNMEMGGFRIFSQRRVLVCYRDCGIIGFDYKAAVEWQKRLNDVDHFKVLIDGDIKPALENAILKYKVNYIVFMKYINPGKSAFLEPVYTNETFSLYRVVSNPI